MEVERFLGVDRRGGDFGLKPWQINAAVNVMPIDNGESLTLRPAEGTFSAITGDRIGAAGSVMGPFTAGGKVVGLYDANGAAPALPAGFDALVPMRGPGLVPSAVQPWLYLGHATIGATLCVLMRWQLDASIHLHVFDGKNGAATEVNGTGCPWLALSAEKRTYTPRIGEAGGRLWISSPEDDLWFCPIGQPRIWWEKTADDIAISGYEFYAGTTTGVDGTVLFPADFDDAMNPDRWCGVVVEKRTVNQTSEVWQEITGQVDPPYEKPVWSAVVGQGTVNPTAINWTKVVVPFELLTGVDCIRVRIVPPTNNGGWRRRSNRMNTMENVFDTVEEKWLGTGTVKRFVVRDPASFPILAGLSADYYPEITVNGVAAVMATLLPIETAKFTIDGVGQYCVTAFTLLTDPANTDVVSIRWRRMWDYQASGIWYDYSFALEARKLTVNGREFTTAGNGRIHNTVPLSSLFTFDLVVKNIDGVYTPACIRVVDGVPLDPSVVYLGRIHWGDSSVGSGGGADLVWDETRYQESLLLAGDNRAGRLPTAQHAMGASDVRLLVASRNRLLVVSAGGMVLWRVDGAPSDMGKLDASPIGAGDQPAIRGTVYGGMAIVPSVGGLAAVSLDGQLSDRMNAMDILDGIFGSSPGMLGTPVIHDVVAWTHASAIVVALTVPGDGAPSLWAFIRDGAGKSLGWWRWDVPGMASVRSGSLTVSGSKLLVHGASGTVVAGIDASLTQAGAGTVGTVEFKYQHGGRPSQVKRWVGLDFSTAGRVGLTMTPFASKAPRSLGYLTGSSYQRQPVGFMLSDTAAAFGMTLEEVDGAARVDRFEVRAIPFGR